MSATERFIPAAIERFHRYLCVHHPSPCAMSYPATCVTHCLQSTVTTTTMPNCGWNGRRLTLDSCFWGVGFGGLGALHCQPPFALSCVVCDLVASLWACSVGFNFADGPDGLFSCRHTYIVPPCMRPPVRVLLRMAMLCSCVQGPPSCVFDGCTLVCPSLMRMYPTNSSPPTSTHVSPLGLTGPSFSNTK